MADMSKLPVLDNIQNIDQLKEYVYKLEKQIRFVLQHLDEDNLSADLVRMIKSSDGSEALQTAIEQNSKSIALKASKKTVDSLGKQVKENNATLSVQANEIAAIVEETSPGVYKLTKAAILLGINGDGSYAKIQADNISLEGLFTANNYFKILEDGSMEAVNGTFSGQVDADSGQIGALVAGSDGATLRGDFKIEGNLQITGTMPTQGVTPSAAGLSGNAGKIVTVGSDSAFGTMPATSLNVTDGTNEYSLLLLKTSTTGSGGGGSGGSVTYNIMSESMGSVYIHSTAKNLTTNRTGTIHSGTWYVYDQYVNNSDGSWYHVYATCTYNGSKVSSITSLSNAGWVNLGSTYVTTHTGVPT